MAKWVKAPDYPNPIPVKRKERTNSLKVVFDLHTLAPSQHTISVSKVSRNATQNAFRQCFREGNGKMEEKAKSHLNFFKKGKQTNKQEIKEKVKKIFETASVCTH